MPRRREETPVPREGPEGQIAVRARGLRKHFGAIVALDGVSFDGPRGGVLAYLGPNGAGKTTTVRILCGLAERDGGEISILGRDVRSDPLFVKSHIGVVPEASNLYPELGCRRNLEYLGELYGLPRAERRGRAVELIEHFGLTEKAEQPFGSLSRGMRRRLAIAAAIVHRPEVLFLDEPTTGLDVPSAKSLRQLIRRTVVQGTTVFLTTHNLFEAEELADEVAVLVGGRIIAGGTVAEIRARVPRARGVSLRLSEPVAEDVLRSACPAIRSAGLEDGCWQLDVTDLHETLGQLVEFCRRTGLRVNEIGTRQTTLEEAFLSLLTETTKPTARGAS